jgi:beta-lactamase regulating signal transducer with metallopeptidase domain
MKMLLTNLPLVVLAALVAVLYIAIATSLVRKYLRTHDVGFLWLCAAVVVWPLLAPLSEYGKVALTNKFAYEMASQMSNELTLPIGQLIILLTYSQRVIGLSLLLVAVFYLSKSGQGRRADRPAVSN